MKVLFCKVSCMKYYKGVCDKDQAYNGGKFVEEYGYGYEEFNFLPLYVQEEKNGLVYEKEYCFGFVETKSTRKTRRNELHIERIKGCKLLKKEESVDNVLVVWCATSDLNETTVVGWYKNATVYRNYQDLEIEIDGWRLERCYNVIADAKDCVLLPEPTRHRHIWNVPSARYTKSFGFGQSLVWYATEESAKGYLQRLIKNIEEYDGENWLYRFPEDED